VHAKSALGQAWQHGHGIGKRHALTIQCFTGRNARRHVLESLNADLGEGVVCILQQLAGVRVEPVQEVVWNLNGATMVLRVVAQANNVARPVLWSPWQHTVSRGLLPVSINICRDGESARLR
jgi:hypothetical protein